MSKSTLQKEQYRMRKLDLNELNRYLEKIQMRLDELGIGQHFDIKGRKIIHLANAIELTDAVPFGQMEDLIEISEAKLKHLRNPGVDGSDGEDVWVIPGKDGLPGVPGRTGIPGKDGDDGEDSWPIPSGTNPIELPKFSAHKNGTNQTGIVTETHTKVTFTTEVYDVGGGYDIVNSKWIPGIIGKAHIDAAVYWTVGVDQIPYMIKIYLNGIIYKNIGINASGIEIFSQSINCDVPITAITDYIEIYVYQTSGADKIIMGLEQYTWFMGHMLP